MDIKKSKDINMTRSPIWRKNIWVLIPIVLTFSVYFNSIKGEFVWDDQTIVVRNDAIKNFKNIPYVFKNEFAEMADYNGNVYRPTQEISYMLDYWLWGMDPKGFHLTNVLLMVMCTALLFFLIKYITGSGLIALISSAIFGVHPVNTEAIAYISGRSDPIYLLFLLMSFILYVRSEKSQSRIKGLFLAASVVSYAASLVSRETAVMFPFILMAYEKFAVKSSKIDWKKVMPFILVLTCYAVLRLKIIEINKEHIKFFSANAIIFTDMKIIVKYIALLLFPFNLHMERRIPVAVAPDAGVLFGFVIVAAIVYLSLRLKKTRKDIFFWVLWFLIFLLPHLNFMRLNAMYAEHWICGASIGLYVLLAFALEKAAISGTQGKKIAYLSFIGIVIYLASLTIARNEDWRDEPSIYLNTLKYNKVPRILSNLGVHYDIKGEYAKSIELYKEALEIAPRVPLYHNNIAIVYLKAGNTKEAVRHWGVSLSIDPNQPKIREFLNKYNTPVR